MKIDDRLFLLISLHGFWRKTGRGYVLTDNRSTTLVHWHNYCAIIATYNILCSLVSVSQLLGRHNRVSHNLMGTTIIVRKPITNGGHNGCRGLLKRNRNAIQSRSGLGGEGPSKRNILQRNIIAAKLVNCWRKTRSVKRDAVCQYVCDAVRYVCMCDVWCVSLPYHLWKRRR